MLVVMLNTNKSRCVEMKIFSYYLKSFFFILLLVNVIPLYADFEVISPNTKHYSNQLKIGSGSLQSDSGTVYAYGYKSGSRIKIYLKTTNGKSLLQDSVFAVYRGSISSSNEVASSGNLKGKSSGYVYFTPRSGSYDYRVVLATQTSDGTQVGFYINDPISIKYIEDEPSYSVDSVSPTTGKVGEAQTYLLRGEIPSTIAFTIDGASCNRTNRGTSFAQFSCTPGVAGNKKYTASHSSGGITLKTGTISVANVDPSVTSFSANPSNPRKFESITFTAQSDVATSNVKFKCGGGSWNSSAASSGNRTWTYTRSVGLKENTSCYVDIDGNGSSDKSLSLSLRDPRFELSNSNGSPKVGETVTFNVVTDSIESGYSIQVRYLSEWFSMTTSNRRNWSHSRLFSSAANKTIYYRIIRDGDNSIIHTASSSITVSTPVAAVSSVTPKTGEVGVEQDYTIIGENFPSTLVFGFPENNADCTRKSFTTSRAVFSCTVQDEGSLKFVVRGKSGDDSTDIKTGSIDISLKDTSSAGSVVPNPGFVNDSYKFSVTLTGDLPSGYDVNISLADDSGNWTLGNHKMTGGPRTFEYRRPISKAGNNRRYRIAIFKDITRKTDWHYGTYTVKERPVTVSSVSPLVGEVNKPQTFTVNGQNLPSSIVFTIADADDCSQKSFSTTKATFYCIPRAEGQKAFIVEDKTLGNDLERGTITVGSENGNSITSYLSQGEPVVADILSATNLDKTLSRAEASILLDVFLSKENPSYKKDMSEYPKPFADADNGADYFEAITRLAYFKGKQDSETVLTKENSLLRPLDEVLRQEFVKMVIQGMDLQINRGTSHISHFTDFNLVNGKWPEGYFNTAVAEGLIFGNVIGSEKYLKPLDALTIKEALLVLKRAKGKTEHDGSGFESSDAFDGTQLLTKVIGFEYEPAYYLQGIQPISITNIAVTSPNNSDKTNCGVVDGNTNFKVLAVTATTDSSSKVHEYYWWTTNFGYFRQYGSDDQFKRVCFFPATTQPARDYLVEANGGDNVGYVSRESETIAALSFTYGNGVSVDVPSNQIVDIKYTKSANFMLAGNAFSLDFNATQIRKTGVELGIEHVTLRLLINGERYEVFSGQPLSGVATFIVPDNSDFYGKNAQLEITLNTQQIKSVKTTENIKFLPRFVVGGKVFNAGVDNNVSSVKVGDQTITLDENDEFYVELDSQTEITGLEVAVLGGVEVNAFNTETVDLTYSDPRAFMVFVGEDRTVPEVIDTDNDGVSDGLDAFPNDPAEYADFDSDGTGDNADLDDDNDNLPDSWELSNGLDPKDTSDANVDSDNDGYTNIEEYENGSDPKDDTSIPIQKWQQLSLENCNRLVSDSELTCDVLYTTSDNNPNLTGIGFQLHFDANKLQWLGADNIYSDSLFDSSITPSNDVADGDSDASTTEYILTGWAGLQSQWPGEVLPVTLFTAKFKVNESLSLGDSTTIRFSPVDTADGYGFKSEPETLTVQNGCALDVDDDGQSRPLTDGLLLLRYQFGFRDNALLNGAVSGDAKRSSASNIQTYLEGCSTDFDIDGSGDTRPLTDGLLTLRYLFGFRDDALINGAVSEGAKRSNAATITDYLQQYH